MRRRLTLLLGLAGCLGLVGLVFMLMFPRERITRANYERIQVGMSEAEMEALLGEPVGREDTQGQEVGYASRAFWHGEEGMIEVHFDGNGGVLDAAFVEFPARSSGLWDGLRARLGW